MSLKSKQEFMDVAKPLTCVLNGQTVTANPKEFKTGSVGWNIPGKMDVQLPNGDTVEVQISANLTVRHSKDLPQTTPAAEAPAA